MALHGSNSTAYRHPPVLLQSHTAVYTPCTPKLPGRPPTSLPLSLVAASSKRCLRCAGAEPLTGQQQKDAAWMLLSYLSPQPTQGRLVSMHADLSSITLSWNVYAPVVVRCLLISKQPRPPIRFVGISIYGSRTRAPKTQARTDPYLFAPGSTSTRSTQCTIRWMNGSRCQDSTFCPASMY